MLLKDLIIRCFPTLKFTQTEDCHLMVVSFQVTASSFRERDTLISQAANLVVRGGFFPVFGD